ncbi:MAG: hypothetical protein EXR11_06745 [Rhodospirillaceae bacterium]|nr:hypothetical protein [Rhodospirillaceae bacterium]
MTMKLNVFRLAMLGSVAVLSGITGVVTPLAPARAQQVAGIEEVVVTARKRQEKLLETPVAVSAVTAKDIESLSLANLNDVTKATPGFFISTYGTQRNDRASQVLTVRGMPPSINTIPSASVFINGAPVTGGFVPGVGDLERVEVVKGPQSAYFGRSSFAGAINLVTKKPGDEFKGSVSMLGGSNSWHDLSASVETPLVTDMLRVRLSGRTYSTHGQYQNSEDLSRLGDRRTESIYGVIDYTPADNFRANVFVTHWEDKDGAPATGKFTAANDFNCRAGGTGTYLCGTLPKFPESRLGVNFPLATPLTGGNTFISLVVQNGGGFAGPLGPARHSSAGLYREAWHATGTLEYDIPSLDVTLSSVTAYNQQYLDNIVNSYAEDLRSTPNVNFGRVPNVYSFPTLLLTQSKIKDFSQELRATSDQAQPLRWMLASIITRPIRALGASMASARTRA